MVGQFSYIYIPYLNRSPLLSIGEECNVWRFAKSKLHKRVLRSSSTETYIWQNRPILGCGISLCTMQSENIFGHRQCNLDVNAWFHHQFLMSCPLNCAPFVIARAHFNEYFNIIQIGLSYTGNVYEKLKHCSIATACWNIHWSMHLDISTCSNFAC